VAVATRRQVIAIVLEQAPVLPSWRSHPPFHLLKDLSLSDAAFVVGWEIQSQISTIMLVTLIAFISIWAALITMLIWSLIAHFVYVYAREHGLPDLVTVQAPKTDHGPSTFLRHAAGSAVRVWFVGLHNMVFAHVACSVLRGGDGFRRRAKRIAILGLGMTLFGVTTAEHLLRRAGFSGPSLRYRGMIGPFLNVPYRIFLGAAVMHGLVHLMHAFAAWGLT
jgi:hypothetical protein